MWAPSRSWDRILANSCKNTDSIIQGVPLQTLGTLTKTPLLNRLVFALELYSSRFQSLMNRFSIGWAFFLMPPTWKTRWCYYFCGIWHPSSIPRTVGIFFHFSVGIFLWNDKNTLISCPSFARELTCDDAVQNMVLTQEKSYFFTPNVQVFSC